MHSRWGMVGEDPLRRSSPPAEVASHGKAQWQSSTASPSAWRAASACRGRSSRSSSSGSFREYACPRQCSRGCQEGWIHSPRPRRRWGTRTSPSLTFVLRWTGKWRGLKLKSRLTGSSVAWTKSATTPQAAGQFGPAVRAEELLGKLHRHVDRPEARNSPAFSTIVTLQRCLRSRAGDRASRLT